jgi:hypothetical protein
VSLDCRPDPLPPLNQQIPSSVPALRMECLVRIFVADRQNVSYFDKISGDTDISTEALPR